MSNAEVFSKIYKEDLWHGGSGAGSKIENVKEYVDILQIGARNMQNYSLLKALGGAGKPIMLKRGLCATYNE